MRASVLSVLIPTRKRLERLQTLLHSVRHTTYGSELELVFRVDDDDQDTVNFLHGQVIQKGSIQVLVGPRHRGYKSMPQFFNEMADVATGDVLMCGNDDMVFRTPDWPTYILDAANEHPDGVYNIGYTTLNAENFPFSTISRRAVKAMGYMWAPDIFWGDIFLRDVMSFFGRCTMLPNVLIDHDWAGWKPDQVYMEQLEPGEYTKDIIRRDPTYWTGTHRVCVDEAVGRIKGLLNA